MITKDQASALRHGDIIFTRDQNADGSPARWRVTGKLKTWKTRPLEFSLPLKHGMYVHGYLNETNADVFFMTEIEAVLAMTPTQKLKLPSHLRTQMLALDKPSEPYD